MTSRSRHAALLGCLLKEFILYGGCVSAYCVLVLEFLGGWLKRVSELDTTAYAVTGLLLIGGQGLLLEMLTRTIWRALRRRLELAP